MRLLSELQRRDVFRVVALYVVSAWLALQVAGVLADLLRLPDWFGLAVLVILVTGLPVALILAWVYKLTPEGISRESDVDDGISIRQVTGRRIDFIIIALLAAALIVVATEIIVGLSRESGVCVLPLDSLGDDPMSIAIAAGFTEEIHYQLLQAGEVKVLPRNSCLIPEDGDSVEETRKLGVGYLVEGSYRQFGERARVAIQLVQATDRTHCWSRVYDEDVTDDVGILDLQKKIAESIVADMHIPCLDSPRPTEDPKCTTSPEARWQYEMGMQRLEKNVAMHNPEAARYFEKAAELDPECADAYAGLAFVTVGDEVRRRELSLKALGLNRWLGLARATLAASYGAIDPRRARIEFDRALDLDADNVLVKELFGDYLSDAGNPEAALELYRSGFESDPLAIRLYLKTACLLEASGHEDDAQVYRGKAADIDPVADLSCKQHERGRFPASTAMGPTS